MRNNKTKFVLSTSGCPVSHTRLQVAGSFSRFMRLRLSACIAFDCSHPPFVLEIIFVYADCSNNVFQLIRQEAGNFSPASGFSGQPVPDHYPERLLGF
jgi:hypothetical protein